MTDQKAYIVREPHDGHAALVFATNGAAARRDGACELDTDFSSIESCNRMPSLDSYAPGPVPPMVLLEHGWWFECSSCGQQVSAEMQDPDDETEADPVADGTRVYCNATHRAQHWAEDRQRADTEAALIEAALTHFPGVTPTWAGTQWDPKTRQDKTTVSFRFPGGANTVEWYIGTATAWVAIGDMDAWKIFRAGANK